MIGRVLEVGDREIYPIFQGEVSDFSSRERRFLSGVLTPVALLVIEKSEEYLDSA